MYCTAPGHTGSPGAPGSLAPAPGEPAPRTVSQPETSDTSDNDRVVGRRAHPGHRGSTEAAAEAEETQGDESPSETSTG